MRRVDNDLYDPNSFDQRLGAAVYRVRDGLRRNIAPKALKRRLLHPATIGVAYAAIGFGAFGHVASQNYRAGQYEYAACDHSRQVNERNAYNSCNRPDAVTAAIFGIAAGVFWPLYLSWEAQQ